MFQILSESNIDFMAWRRVVLTFSAVAVLVSAVIVGMHGLNLGIEFTGGTELQLKFASTPRVGEIRDALSRADLPKPAVTTIGDPAENEIVVHLASSRDAATREDLAGTVLTALRSGLFSHESGKVDLNIDDQSTLGTLLAGAPGLGASEANALAEAVLARRKEVAIYTDWNAVGAVPGMRPEVLDYLRQNAELGPMAVRGQSYIGPAIGKELKRNAVLAIFGSLIGMLIYIWWRFQLKWGFAAVLALAHDTVITLGLFSIFNKEMSLPVVAAFLTLVGYSVNDTVVVFDRIRENIRARKNDDLIGVVNRSINQTLSRTIVTSGLTWIMCLGLFLFGGAALNPFAFVLVIGIIVGTYSSICVASPIVLLSGHLFGRRAAAERVAVREARVK